MLLVVALLTGRPGPCMIWHNTTWRDTIRRSSVAVSCCVTVPRSRPRHDIMALEHCAGPSPTRKAAPSHCRCKARLFPLCTASTQCGARYSASRRTLHHIRVSPSPPCASYGARRCRTTAVYPSIKRHITVAVPHEVGPHCVHASLRNRT